MAMLVTPAELEAHRADPDWVVFDTRHDLMDPARGPRVYAEGHVPGAYFLHVDHDLSGPKSGTNGRHPLPDPQVLAARLNRCGVAAHRQVVVYDDMGGNWSVRLWWMLRWLGHERVALLDGQYNAWVREQRAVTTEAPADRAGSFDPRPRVSFTVDAAFVERDLAARSAKLLDARAPDRFAGRVEPVDPVAGHIPGAVNRFWQENLGEGGRFLSPAELRAEFEAALGGSDPSRVVHLCGSGVTACHNLFAMELAGLEGSRLYPGSWSEWCSDPARPVERSA